MPRKVDRQGGKAEGQDRRVPRVRVEAGAVQEGDDRLALAVPQSAQHATVVEGQREALTSRQGSGDAGIRRLIGQERELVYGVAHGVHSRARGGVMRPSVRWTT